MKARGVNSRVIRTKEERCWQGVFRRGTKRRVLCFLVMLLTMTAVPVWSKNVAAENPLFILLLSQITTGDRSTLSVDVKTTLKYPCEGFVIDLSQLIRQDTVTVIIGGVTRPNPCVPINSEATGTMVLPPLEHGVYVLRIRYKKWSDLYQLTVESDRFVVAPITAMFTDVNRGRRVPARDSTQHGDQKPIRIFLDCSPDCYQDYVKTELNSFDYVRDKEFANIYLLITSQAAGNGGQRVTLTFVGMNEFSGLTDTTSFGTQQTDTDDVIRQTLVRYIKAGTVRYAARTRLADDMEISFPESVVQTTPEEDPWNSWVFNADLSFELNGQKSTDDTKLSGSFSANRVTDDWKIRLGLSGSYAENVYSFGDETYRSIYRSEYLTGLGVKSLNDHWSAGGYLSFSSSTYDNTRLLLSVAPAIEYNFFRYSMSTRRECRLLYRIGLNRYNYLSETIYFKNDETVGSHSLSFVFGLSEPWGRASIKVAGSQYLHDLSKNRFEFSGDLSVRVIEGLSFRVYGIVSLIHDQISLPALGATQEEILLQRRELETTYSFYTGLGVSYTFGSIFSNIVNPRFGE
jgi:hypothetical protein